MNISTWKDRNSNGCDEENKHICPVERGGTTYEVLVMRTEEQPLVKDNRAVVFGGKPYAVKVACTVWSRGKDGDIRNSSLTYCYGIVMLIGGIQFALAWQRQDSESKSNAMLTVMAGAMVAGLSVGYSMFFAK